jgi:putative spermidine/putrescine transport system ATP-binding protein
MVYRPALLMDEPGASTAAARAASARDRRVHRERGISVLYVPHDQEEALLPRATARVFNKGRIEQIGTPEELYDWPATRSWRASIGDTNLRRTVLGVADGV